MISPVIARPATTTPLRFRSEARRHPEVPATPQEQAAERYATGLLLTRSAGYLGGFLSSFNLFKKPDIFLLDSQIIWSVLLTSGGALGGIIGYMGYKKLQNTLQAGHKWLKGEDKPGQAGSIQSLATDLERAEAMIAKGLTLEYKTALKLLKRMDEKFTPILENPETYLEDAAISLQHTQILAAKTKSYIAHIMQHQKDGWAHPMKEIQEYYRQAFSLLTDAIPPIQNARNLSFNSNSTEWEQMYLQDTIENLPELEMEGYHLAINIAHNTSHLNEFWGVPQSALGWGHLAHQLACYIYDADTPILKGLATRLDKLEERASQG